MRLALLAGELRWKNNKRSSTPRLLEQRRASVAIVESGARRRDGASATVVVFDVPACVARRTRVSGGCLIPGIRHYAKWVSIPAIDVPSCSSRRIFALLSTGCVHGQTTQRTD
jgi:hypothetical protein